MRRWRTCGIVFALSVLADACYTLHVVGAAHHWMWSAVLAGAAIPFINFLGWVWFVEAKTTCERLEITASTSLGIFVGTLGTLLTIGR